MLQRVFSLLWLKPPRQTRLTARAQARRLAPGSFRSRMMGCDHNAALNILDWGRHTLRCRQTSAERHTLWPANGDKVTPAQPSLLTNPSFLGMRLISNIHDAEEMLWYWSQRNTGGRLRLSIVIPARLLIFFLQCFPIDPYPNTHAT